MPKLNKCSSVVLLEWRMEEDIFHPPPPKSGQIMFFLFFNLAFEWEYSLSSRPREVYRFKCEQAITS